MSGAGAGGGAAVGAAGASAAVGTTRAGVAAGAAGTATGAVGTATGAAGVAAGTVAPPPVPHLLEHLRAYREATGRVPRYVEALRTEEGYEDQDVVYPIGADLFVHVHPDPGGLLYEVVEPRLAGEEEAALQQIRTRVFARAMYRPPPQDAQEMEAGLHALFDEAAAVPTDPPVPAGRLDVLRYHLLRDVVRLGLLQPFLQDPNLEDIHAVGDQPIHVIHKFFDMLPTNVRFRSNDQLDAFLRNLSERLGRPVSDARPIVDATLSDGSRINVVYSRDVSRRGPSFSIRRIKADPITVPQLIAWGTMTAELAAYVWLCLEHGMNLFVCGEAACGKSVTLNAFLSFVDPRAKVYSAEDTPEVRPPHRVWQRLLTRENGPAHSRVQMFDLLRAALRSRPNYIVVGEIRGAEGAVAFQGMQTGHPTVATFHATDKVKMIQRLSSPPINVPLTFIDNLNVAVFQQAFHQRGRLVRRIVSVDEIQGYSSLHGGVVTLPVFGYDAATDRQVFGGRNNSFILERRIAEQHGYDDPSKIYDELDKRTRILQAFVDRKVFAAADVDKAIAAYHDRGEAGLPFPV